MMCILAYHMGIGLFLLIIFISERIGLSVIEAGFGGGLLWKLAAHCGGDAQCPSLWIGNAPEILPGLAKCQCCGPGSFFRLWPPEHLLHESPKSYHWLHPHLSGELPAMPWTSSSLTARSSSKLRSLKVLSFPMSGRGMLPSGHKPAPMLSSVARRNARTAWLRCPWLSQKTWLWSKSRRQRWAILPGMKPSTCAVCVLKLSKAFRQMRQPSFCALAWWPCRMPWWRLPHLWCQVSTEMATARPGSCASSWPKSLVIFLPLATRRWWMPLQVSLTQLTLWWWTETKQSWGRLSFARRLMKLVSVGWMTSAQLSWPWKISQLTISIGWPRRNAPRWRNWVLSWAASRTMRASCMGSTWCATGLPTRAAKKGAQWCESILVALMTSSFPTVVLLQNHQLHFKLLDRNCECYFCTHCSCQKLFYENSLFVSFPRYRKTCDRAQITVPKALTAWLQEEAAVWGLARVSWNLFVQELAPKSIGKFLVLCRDFWVVSVHNCQLLPSGQITFCVAGLKRSCGFQIATCQFL